MEFLNGYRGTEQGPEPIIGKQSSHRTCPDPNLEVTAPKSTSLVITGGEEARRMIPVLSCDCVSGLSKNAVNDVTLDVSIESLKACVGVLEYSDIPDLPPHKQYRVPYRNWVDKVELQTAKRDQLKQAKSDAKHFAERGKQFVKGAGVDADLLRKIRMAKGMECHNLRLLHRKQSAIGLLGAGHKKGDGIEWPIFDSEDLKYSNDPLNCPLIGLPFIKNQYIRVGPPSDGGWLYCRHCGCGLIHNGRGGKGRQSRWKWRHATNPTAVRTFNWKLCSDVYTMGLVDNLEVELDSASQYCDPEIKSEADPAPQSPAPSATQSNTAKSANSQADSEKQMAVEVKKDWVDLTDSETSGKVCVEMIKLASHNPLARFQGYNLSQLMHCSPDPYDVRIPVDKTIPLSKVGFGLWEIKAKVLGVLPDFGKYDSFGPIDVLRGAIMPHKLLTLAVKAAVNSNSLINAFKIAKVQQEIRILYCPLLGDMVISEFGRKFKLEQLDEQLWHALLRVKSSLNIPSSVVKSVMIGTALYVRATITEDSFFSDTFISGEGGLDQIPENDCKRLSSLGDFIGSDAYAFGCKPENEVEIPH